jgi:hypothetical protein
MDLTVELLTIRGTNSTNPWPPGPLENKIQGIKKAGNAAGFISYVTPKRDVAVVTFS